VRENTIAAAPTWDTLDPSQITGSSILARDYSPTDVFGAIRAPTAAGTYTLVFRTGSAWRAALPGTSITAGVCTKTFAAGEALVGVQITEIIKAGSSAGAWEVLP
jgi:hypothetical protein